MRVAPGRTHDIEMLLKRRKTARTHEQYVKVEEKIEYLRKEGADPKMHSFRWRLLRASIAGDNLEIERISHQIYAYQRYNGAYRHLQDNKLD